MYDGGAVYLVGYALCLVASFVLWFFHPDDDEAASAATGVAVMGLIWPAVLVASALGGLFWVLSRPLVLAKRRFHQRRNTHD